MRARLLESTIGLGLAAVALRFTLSKDWSLVILCAVMTLVLGVDRAGL